MKEEQEGPEHRPYGYRACSKVGQVIPFSGDLGGIGQNELQLTY